MSKLTIPVVDLFAGPGGLGEGFSAFGREKGQAYFKICLSIEKDYWAYQTLLLRHFYRMIKNEKDLRGYYNYIRTENLTESRVGYLYRQPFIINGEDFFFEKIEKS